MLNALKANGRPIQFGATPKMGCSEAVFSLKILLQSRREHGIDSYAASIDLTKACDIIKHEVIAIALKMGTPDRHAKWVKKLHGDFNPALKMDREDISVK